MVLLLLVVLGLLLMGNLEHVEGVQSEEVLLKPWLDLRFGGGLMFLRLRFH